MRRKILSLWMPTLLFLGPLMMSAQEPQAVRMQAPVVSKSQIVSPDGKATFSFELVLNHIVIPVEINGSIVKLILDTGMPLEGAILFGSKTIDQLNLSVMGKAPIRGAGGTTVESDLAMGINFELPGVKFSGQMVMVMPYDDIRNHHYEGKDGIIGASLFNHFVVSIDYEKMEITLTDPARFSYSGKGEKIPLEIARYPMAKCHAEMESGKKGEVNLVIDTGNSDALSLNVGSAEAIVLPKKVIDIYKVSLQKEIPFQAGRIKSFQIGSFRLKDVLVSFSTEPPPPWGKEGNLGQGILKRFNVIIDYAHQTMILEPNKTFHDPFDFNMAGILFIRTEDGLFKITHIVPDSPAAEAELKKGDLLEIIDGKPVTELAKDEVFELLKQQGREVILTAKRDGAKIKVLLTLRRLI